MADEDQTLREFLRGALKENAASMVARPMMYGFIRELEAIWHFQLWYEAMILEPRPTDKVVQDAIFESRELICIQQKWPCSLPFSTHGLSEAEMMVILSEMRTLFFKTLGHPEP